jgi:hypothetical protein
MANPAHLFRVDGRLDELVVRIRPWSDDVVDKLGFDPRSSYVEDFWLGPLDHVVAPPVGGRLRLQPGRVRPRLGRDGPVTWARGPQRSALPLCPVPKPHRAVRAGSGLRARGAVCAPTAPAAQPRPAVAALTGLAGAPRRLASRAVGDAGGRTTAACEPTGALDCPERTGALCRPGPCAGQQLPQSGRAALPTGRPSRGPEASSADSTGYWRVTGQIR